MDTKHEYIKDLISKKLRPHGLGSEEEVNESLAYGVFEEVSPGLYTHTYPTAAPHIKIRDVYKLKNENEIKLIISLIRNEERDEEWDQYFD